MMNHFTVTLNNLITERTQIISLNKGLFISSATLETPLIGVLLYPEEVISWDRLENRQGSNSQYINHFGEHPDMKGVEQKREYYKIKSRNLKINLWSDQTYSVYTCIFNLGLVEGVNFDFLRDSYFRPKALEQNLIDYTIFYSEILRNNFPDQNLYAKIIINEIQSLLYTENHQNYKWENPSSNTETIEFDLYSDLINTEESLKEEIIYQVQVIKNNFIRKI